MSRSYRAITKKYWTGPGGTVMITEHSCGKRSMEVPRLNSTSLRLNTGGTTVILGGSETSGALP